MKRSIACRYWHEQQEHREEPVTMKRNRPWEKTVAIDRNVIPFNVAFRSTLTRDRNRAAWHASIFNVATPLCLRIHAQFREQRLQLANNLIRHYQTTTSITRPIISAKLYFRLGRAAHKTLRALIVELIRCFCINKFTILMRFSHVQTKLIYPRDIKRKTKLQTTSTFYSRRLKQTDPATETRRFYF